MKEDTTQKSAMDALCKICPAEKEIGGCPYKKNSHNGCMESGTINTDKLRDMLLLQDILAHPCATVKPVIHGNWINLSVTGLYISCSMCGQSCRAKIIRQPGEIKIDPWNFCPNCGADMREEKNNEV